MRTSFINRLHEIARSDDDVYLITADLGFSVFEEFHLEFKDRFINVGIAETAMIGIAAGLALNGKKVYCYSIIPFITMRCFEQIRVDLCYQNLNVNLVGVGGGFSYGSAGATHHAIEDLAIMRALPNMRVICPGDPFEAENAVSQVLNFDGPSYIRLNKNNEKRLYEEGDVSFGVGKGIKIFDGVDISILTTGNMLEETLKITERLQNDGYKVKLFSMPYIKPFDKNAVIECLLETNLICTIEEHSLIGGLGTVVSEVIALNCDHKTVKFRQFGIQDEYAGCSGSSDYFRKKYQIDEDSIYNELVKELNMVI